MIILERDVEAYLKKRVEGLGGKCYKIPATFEEGIPDRLVILPGNWIAFVELKRPKGGKLSEMQKYKHKQLRSLGCQVFVIKNYAEVDEMLKGGDAK